MSLVVCTLDTQAVDTAILSLESGGRDRTNRQLSHDTEVRARTDGAQSTVGHWAEKRVQEDSGAS